MQTNAIAQKIAQAMYDKKARDVVALDVHELTVLCEYMVIGTGRSTPQVQALCDNVQEEMAKLGLTPIRVEGENEARWVVMDFGSILVHIFHIEERDYYNLERLWSDGQNRLVLPFDNTVND